MAARCGCAGQKLSARSSRCHCTDAHRVFCLAVGLWCWWPQLELMGMRDDLVECRNSFLSTGYNKRHTCKFAACSQECPLQINRVSSTTPHTHMCMDGSIAALDARWWHFGPERQAGNANMHRLLPTSSIIQLIMLLNLPGWGCHPENTHTQRDHSTGSVANRTCRPLQNAGLWQEKAPGCA